MRLDRAMMSAERRLMRVVVPQERVVRMCRQGAVHGPYRTVSGVPEGATFCGMQSDPERMLVHMYFEHESFPVVPSGGVIPELEIVMERVEP